MIEPAAAVGYVGALAVVALLTPVLFWLGEVAHRWMLGRLP